MSLRPSPAAPSIRVNQPGPYQIGDAITFTVTVPKLVGNEYPMVLLDSVAADGTSVCKQLARPEEPFILGSGSSRWINDPADPYYHVAATCTGYLYAYGGKSKGYDTIRLLAQTAPFSAG